MKASGPRTVTDPYGLGEMSQQDQEKLLLLLTDWVNYPVHFICDGLGATPDPWQCDVIDTVWEQENVAVRACHGVGKTAVMAWAAESFLVLRPYSEVITTAPTYVKQVKDVMWKEMYRWWREGEVKAPWLTSAWSFTTTRLQHRKIKDWFALGVSSTPSVNMEGFHAPHILVEIDEAKGVLKPAWDAVHGMRMTQKAHFLVGSTPGGPLGEFFKVFTKYRQTWKHLFVIHPLALKEKLKRPEARGVYPANSKRAGQEAVGKFSHGGTYYSHRVTPERVEERRLEWGADSPVFIARVIGDFPSLEGDVLIQYGHIALAEDREKGVDGPCWVGCDVARYGADRTVAFVAQGGTIVHGESIARSAAQSTAPEVQEFGVGDDAKRPEYRSEVATANMLYRLVVDYGAQGAIIDDTGLGGGVTDILRDMGIRTIPISFGVPPTDVPRTPELKKMKQARNQPVSVFKNLKMQMAWALRSAFESNTIALAALSEEVRDPLVAQLSLVKTKMNEVGQLCLVDPDEGEDDDDWSNLLGSEERHKSPDHFHALLLAWWMAGTAAPFLMPQSKAILPGNVRLAGRVRRMSPAQQAVKSNVPNPVAATMKGHVAGPGRYLGGLYRTR